MSEVQSINLVEDAEGELRVSSLVIAGRTENQHKNVLELVNRYREDLEAFGQVAFETRARLAGQHGGGDTTYVLLNEPQSTLLMTFMRNSPVVVEFKVELVKQFYTMRKALSAPRPVAELDRRQLALMVLEAEDARAAAEQKAVEMQPKADYVDRFVGQTSDAITVDVFASQFGSTGPKVRELLVEKNIAVRKFMGERWSNTEQRMKSEYEWRPRQGVKSSDWFDLRPQHNAPRLHNGQVKQTMYVRQFHAQELAIALGLVPPVRAVEGVA